MTRSNESLFDRYRRRGDVRALAKVFDRTAPELLRIAMHVARDPIVAEDLLQETFLAAIESAERYSASRPLVPWLAGILTNQARRRKRADARRPDPERLVRAQSTLPDGELTAEVAQAIDALPAQFRQVLMLRLRFGMEHAEIANVLDMQPATVRTRLHRGLVDLRKRLPAGLTLGVGPVVPERGIDTVREMVLAKASAAAVTTTAVSTAVLFTVGGVVVTKTKIFATAALVLAVLGGGLAVSGWLGADGDDPESRPDPLTTSREQPGPVLGTRAREDDAATTTETASVHDAPSTTTTTTATPWKLSGRVLDTGGDAVPRAHVRVSLRRGEAVTRLAPTRADDDGVYGVDIAVVGTWPTLRRITTDVVVRAYAPGFMPSKRETIELAEQAVGEPIERNVELTAGVLVTGRVLDVSGRPLPQATVTLRTEPKKDNRAYAHTDEHGRFVIGTEKPGTYSLGASAETGFASGEPKDIPIGTTTVMDDLIVRFGESIRGRVIDAKGRPVPRTDVFAHWRPRENGERPPSHVQMHQPRARTDAEGRFVLPVQWTGPYLVQLSGSWARPVKQTARAGDHDVVLRVRGHMLVLRVVDPEGKPLPGTGISMLGWRGKAIDLIQRVQAGELTLDEARTEAYASSAGDVSDLDATSLKFVEPGTVWRISAYASGAVPEERIITIPKDGSTTRVDLVIRERMPMGTLEIDLQGADGEPIRRFAVDVETITGTRLFSAVSDETNGTLPPIPSGRNRIRIAPDAGKNWLEKEYGFGTFHLPLARIVDVPEGGRAKLAATATKGGRFRLELRYPEEKPSEKDRLRVRLFLADEPRAPVQYAGMWFKDENDQSHMSSTYYTGAARLNVKLLRPDDYRLEVRTAEHGTHERTLRILPGEITTVVIDLTN